MFKRLIIIISLIVIISSCVIFKEKTRKIEHKKEMEFLSENEKNHMVVHLLCSFLENNELIFSTNKRDIPDEVFNVISIVNKSSFNIGDSTELDMISFSDSKFMVDGKPLYKYDKLLHFVITDNIQCVLVYKEGGIGSHNVVDYIQDLRDPKIYRISTLDQVDNYTSLIELLNRCKYKKCGKWMK